MDVGFKEDGGGAIVDMSPAATSSIQDRNKDKPCEASVQNTINTSVFSTTFRCERCDDFETPHRSSLLLHVVSCLPNLTKYKMDESDAENATVKRNSIIDQAVNRAQSNFSTESAVSNGDATSCITVTGNASKTVTPSLSNASSTRKVFECDVCNMKFSNGANMRRHKMRHTGVKPYECRVCQKRFFRKDHLAEHFTTHTKTLPYHCPICNRGFQRQIAMRAHFQNEHVGQHDLVKTCPLCSYRAGSMKSLRIHFFNRHGIDLDNPGPGATSSLLLALESQAATQATINADNVSSNINTTSTRQQLNQSNQIAYIPNHQSDSNESLRSVENGSPPMHFLTPHVEISTFSDTGVDMFNNGSAGNNGSRRESIETKYKEQDMLKSPTPITQTNLDSNMKALPSSTSNTNIEMSSSSKSHQSDSHITPSISLIPIKQENSDEISNDLRIDEKISQNEQSNGSETSGSESSTPQKICNASSSSLIKVSPLKSLLREDLKRRICAKASNRMNRRASLLENNNQVHKTAKSNTQNNAICNGTITSTGQENEALNLNKKQILTCLFCGIEFPDETLYFLHKGCHCDSNPWKCNICGEQCNNVYEFNSHLLSKSHQ